MAVKPVIFSLDDEPEVLRAVELDLRKGFGQNYRIMRADNGQAALETLQKIKLRNDPVALFLVDQRMPEMTGVEFLEKAMEIFPDAKRVLLTAYADTEAAIRAINMVKIDYYLMKPWDPPEDKLYPVLGDLLDDWQAAFRPGFDGVRVLGSRWSPKTHYVRDFLARNQIPYQWLDIDSSDEAKKLLAHLGVDTPALPVVFLPDGEWCTDPEISELANRLRLKTRAENPFYDMVIVGGGPAGLAAAVYGGSEGLRTVLIEREAPGGQAGTSSKIENYLGFPQGLSGAELARRAVMQARRFGVEILSPQEVVKVTLDGQYRIVHLADGSKISCHALFIATGVSYRTLDVPGVERLTGAGVYYGAALTEGPYLKDEDVYIIGGANSAGQAAMYFARYARQVNMLVRGPSLSATMSQYLIDNIANTPNIRVVPYTQVIEAHGDERLEKVTLSNSETGAVETVPATGLFIFIGAQPHTDWLGDLVERDEKGFILSGADLIRNGKRPKGWTLDRDPYLLEASVPGIFVVGDVRYRSVKRVASAVGEGSMAVQFVHQYLGGL
jgi:thioredoxin reductase (NADPH)